MAVTRAAALFVLRTLLDDDVPTNEGIARAISIVTPDDCLVNAKWPSAVAAGNVETSQRITDLLFAALADAGIAVPAQGQGTMNNITFGGEGWTFYETLGGGQGASANGPGPSAVHVGMSNTRNTPIESLERSYPILIDEYSIRRGSGGAGAFEGGDGVIAEIQSDGAVHGHAPYRTEDARAARSEGRRGRRGGAEPAEWESVAGEMQSGAAGRGRGDDRNAGRRGIRQERAKLPSGKKTSSPCLSFPRVGVFTPDRRFSVSDLTNS